jgi:hypothetical protein
MKDLAAIRRPTSSRIPEGQTGLALLDATVTGTKAKELETKLHRLAMATYRRKGKFESKAHNELQNRPSR